MQIEVVIELNRDLVEAPEGTVRPLANVRGQALADALISHGMRARMLSQSLLTGQRYIDLDFLPDEPKRIAGLSPRYPELPTTPTAMEKLGERADRSSPRSPTCPSTRCWRTCAAPSRACASCSSRAT